MEEQSSQQAIVEATVRIDYKSYRAYYREFTRNGVWFTLVAAVLALAMTAGLAHAFYREFDAWLASCAILFFSEALLGLALFAFWQALPSRQYKKRLAIFEQAASYVMFFEDCLVADTPLFRSRIRYEYFPEAEEDKVSFYLMLPEGTYTILPKKCFTEGQVTALRALFARKFGDKYKERK